MTKKYNYEGISTLEVLESAKRYNAWIADKVGNYLTSPALEIGAGTGNITDLLQTTYSITVSDVDKRLLHELKNRFKDNKRITYAYFDITKTPQQQLHKKFGSVYAINVLEHIEDDLNALKNIRQTLQQNGSLIVLVPAKKFAYSALDKEIGHYRRYEKNELIEIITNAGFSLKHVEYFNIVGLAGWVGRDIFERNHHQLRPYQIKIMELLVPLLRRIEAVIPMPIGISLIAVATKKE